MANELEFTGERFVPGVAVGEIVYEHAHRYAFARRLAAGRRVLDAACGEGYGSALLAEQARSVVGVDIEASAIAHAAARYSKHAPLRFLEGSVTALPLADATVDLVVSFETIEHVPAADQSRMVAEFARVLAPDGLLLLSSPNRPEYSDARGYTNPFHLHELDRAERQLLARHFPAQRWFRQRLWLGSTIWSEEPRGEHEAWNGDPDRIVPAVPPEAMYFVVLAARRAEALPTSVGLSLFADAEATELKRAEHHAREVLRLDQLALHYAATLDQQTRDIRSLEAQVGERDQRGAALGSRIASLESELAAAQRARDEQIVECERLERAVAAQERLLDHLQSLRGWMAHPWRRVKLWMHRLRGA